ncbi:loricrin-like isoform X7 [Polyodon spathula]|uniref:loricrin-like isoform X7 n=1 Tax=Polyodon spathula TaxID=7913 RepID=UPI001B7E91A6|nr:loricrin-like isoform X7 [Polyodon spathula]
MASSRASLYRLTLLALLVALLPHTAFTKKGNGSKSSGGSKSKGSGGTSSRNPGNTGQGAGSNYPNTGQGKPNSGGGYPNTGGGYPNTGQGKPNSGGGYPNTGQGKPNSGGGYPNTGGGYPNTGQGKPNPGGGYPNTGGGYPNTGGGYPNTGQGYPNTGGGYPNTGGGYPNTGQGYPNPGGGYPNTGGGYPNTGGGYPNSGRGYPNTGGGYPNTGGGYPNPGGGYPNTGGGYPNTGGGYPNTGQGYPNPGGGYPNTGGGYPNSGGGYPNTGGGYPNTGGGYPNTGGGYPNTGGGYPNTGGGTPKIYGPGYNSHNQGRAPWNGGGGSHFSQAVAGQGFKPSHKSKGFGKKAALAAGLGVATGMAMGYGLSRTRFPGSFPGSYPGVYRGPRLEIDFNSEEEERYYNYYMWKRYVATPFGGDSGTLMHYYFRQPAQTYEMYRDRCLKRNDLLPGKETGRAVPSPAATGGDGPRSNINTTAADNSKNITDIFLGRNNSAVDATTNHPVSLSPGNINATETDANNSTGNASVNNTAREAASAPRPAQEDKDDDNVVGVMDVGNPEMIEQMKLYRCIELYVDYTHQYLTKRTETRTRNTQWNGAARLSGSLLLLLGTLLLQ